MQTNLSKDIGNSNINNSEKYRKQENNSFENSTKQKNTKKSFPDSKHIKSITYSDVRPGDLKYRKPGNNKSFAESLTTISNAKNGNSENAFAKKSTALIKSKTISYNEIPSWMKDNVYIRSGYRKPNQSFVSCLSSLGYLHNEFINVWSHLVGVVLFIVLMFVTAIFVFPSIKTISIYDVLVTYIFLTGAVVCLLLSSIYHLFQCHSEQVANNFIKCDYIGIILLIIGSCVPAFFYAFYCHNFLKTLYISMMVVFGILTGIFVMTPKFSDSEWITIRASTFVLMALSGIIPLVHSSISFGISYTYKALQIQYLTPMALFYIAGALIYGARIPERWFPGKFDIYFHSHQIFHFFVVFAAAFHYIGVINALHWTHKLAPICPAF
ncbi:Adiponectin receptor protein [Smittium culicis]|uniref:Adiponectin receptor protein n=1 Tax=Smittium culicis TaxID=133412 RepID=A0A1R1YN19_9FUNG|nr:Adiponectin receptor protein [Smittium culicis]